MFERLKVQRRLDDHEEALARVERRLAALEIQWGDTLDRLKSMMGRILKERARTEAARDEMEPEALSDGGAGSGVAGLSSRQAQINAQILARRNRLGREQ